MLHDEERLGKLASALSALLAFTPRLGERVPLRQLAEHVIEFNAAGRP